MGSPKTACQNIYTFIRLRMGKEISDREIARQWGMDWKSFSALKHGRRMVPRLNELENLARALSVDPAFVFEIARGVSAKKVHVLLENKDHDSLAKLLMAGIHEARASAESREQHFRAIIDRATDAVFTADLQGAFQEVNRRFCELTGYREEDLLARNLFDVFFPGEPARLMEALTPIYRDGEAQGIELWARSRDGKALAFELSASRIDDEQGKPLGVQGIARDTSERKKMEEKLAREHATLKTAFDAVPAVCMLQDKDGTILLANRRLCEIARQPEEEVVGRKPYEILGVDPEPDCPVIRSFATGRFEQKISTMTDEDGAKRFFHRTARPILGSNGQVEQVVQVVVDVTEQVCSGDSQLLVLWRDGPLPPELKDPEDQEKRRFIRVPFRATVDYRTEGKSQTGMARNLARGGLFIETDEILPKGTRVDLQWSFGEKTRIKAAGVVAWTKSGSQGVPGGIGLQFTEISSENRSTIIDYVVQTRKKSA